MQLQPPAAVLIDQQTTPLQKINDPFLDEHGITLYVKREDLLHPHLSGNKWHKLKYNLQCAKAQGFAQVISFGGAYSNHIHALAYAAPLFDLQAVGVIRSDEKVMNPTLADAQAQGMTLHYVTRNDYQRRHEEAYWHTLQAQFGPAYIIPEGGSNSLAVAGCADLINRIDMHGVVYDTVCVACGTGGTMAGLLKAIAADKQVIGFSVLKGDNALEARIQTLLAQLSDSRHERWQLVHDYHQGGYAKVTQPLLRFMKRFTDMTGIPIEPIYTGKMLFGLYSMIGERRLPRGAQVVAIHTGGLQGLRGMPALADLSS